MVFLQLIDSPGHVDFSSEVTAAIRITDGAIVVIDIVEGIRVQTETVLRQALQERLKPVLLINKVDRAIMELQMTKETLYSTLCKLIQSVNNFIRDNVEDKYFDRLKLDPREGNVAFASGLQGWGFTIPQFARLYSKRTGKSYDKLRKRLWGEYYFDPETKKWVRSQISKNTGKKLQRGFCQYVLDPIYTIFEDAFEKDNLTKLDAILQKLGRPSLTVEDKQKQPKKLIRAVMQKFQPASDAMLEMIAVHLPSPVVAQNYRYSLVYNGDAEDKYAQSIKSCDKKGPLIVRQN